MYRHPVTVGCSVEIRCEFPNVAILVFLGHWQLDGFQGSPRVRPNPKILYISGDSSDVGQQSGY